VREVKEQAMAGFDEDDRRTLSLLLDRAIANLSRNGTAWGHGDGGIASP
jgi:hypothetical protein